MVENEEKQSKFRRKAGNDPRGERFMKRGDACDLRELLIVPLRTLGYCVVGRGLSGLHWVWYNGRGPHLEWTQEPDRKSVV